MKPRVINVISKDPQDAEKERGGGGCEKEERRGGGWEAPYPHSCFGQGNHHLSDTLEHFVPLNKGLSPAAIFKEGRKKGEEEVLIKRRRRHEGRRRSRKELEEIGGKWMKGEEIEAKKEAWGKGEE